MSYNQCKNSMILFTLPWDIQQIVIVMRVLISAYWATLIIAVAGTDCYQPEAQLVSSWNIHVSMSILLFLVRNVELESKVVSHARTKVTKTNGCVRTMTK